MTKEKRSIRLDIILKLEPVRVIEGLNEILDAYSDTTLNNVVFKGVQTIDSSRLEYPNFNYLNFIVKIFAEKVGNADSPHYYQFGVLYWNNNPVSVFQISDKNLFSLRSVPTNRLWITNIKNYIKMIKEIENIINFDYRFDNIDTLSLTEENSLLASVPGITPKIYMF